MTGENVKVAELSPLEIIVTLSLMVSLYSHLTLTLDNPTRLSGTVALHVKVKVSSAIGTPISNISTEGKGIATKLECK